MNANRYTPAFFNALQANPIIIDSDEVAALRLIWQARAQEINLRYKHTKSPMTLAGSAESLEEKIYNFFEDLTWNDVFPEGCPAHRDGTANVFRSQYENLFEHSRRGRLHVSMDTIEHHEGTENHHADFLPEYYVETGYFSDTSRDWYLRIVYTKTDDCFPALMEYVEKHVRAMDDAIAPAYVCRAAMEGNSVNFTDAKLDQTKLGHLSFYPYLPVGMDEYIDEYLKSDARILVIYGPAGTAKSTLVRTILSRISKKAVISNDVKALESGAVFSRIEREGYKALAMEDVDGLMRPRDEGNDFMNTLLDQGDGLAESDLKIIISTNLLSLNQFDPALLREGRTFDIILTRELTYDESLEVTDAMNIPTEEMEEKSHTLAQIFSLKRPSFTLFSKRGKKRGALGFV